MKRIRTSRWNSVTSGTVCIVGVSPIVPYVEKIDFAMISKPAIKARSQVILIFPEIMTYPTNFPGGTSKKGQLAWWQIFICVLVARCCRCPSKRRKPRKTAYREGSSSSSLAASRHHLSLLEKVDSLCCFLRPARNHRPPPNNNNNNNGKGKEGGTRNKGYHSISLHTSLLLFVSKIILSFSLKTKEDKRLDFWFQTNKTNKPNKQ